MSLTHLQRLEAESIHIMREVVAEAERPVMLYTAGKDSATMLHIARKAFFPAPPPFPLLHIDTGHNFDEVIAFRDARVAELGERLIVGSVEDSIKKGTVRLRNPQTDSRNAAQAVTLLETIAEYGFDACRSRSSSVTPDTRTSRNVINAGLAIVSHPAGDDAAIK